MINIQEYKPNPKLTREQLFENNFRYIDGCYSYRFPVYKYKKETMLWGILYINLEARTCDITVINNFYCTYASYHNRLYGSNNKVIKAIDKRVKTQLALFLKNELLIENNKKRFKRRK